jgi:nicotinamidase/pyrazinamidase
MKAKKALLAVDVQNDFLPGGALAVPEGERVVPKLNRYIKYFSKKKRPVHCIQNTPGAQFPPKLKLPQETILLYKGMDPEKDSYSVFQAEDLSGMGFLQLLQRQGIKELYVGGLATDYCVRSSILDALRHGFKVKLLTDAVQAVDLRPGDGERAVKEMVKKGAGKTTLKGLR